MINIPKTMLTLSDIDDYQKQRKVPEVEQLSLKFIQQYFEHYIFPYKYSYLCNNGLTIEFFFNKEDFCHFIYGTVKNIPYIQHYKGELGYNCITNGTITLDTVHTSLKSKVKNRIKYFIFLDMLLKKPSIIYYNQKIVKKGKSIPVGDSSIGADFLLYKLLNSKHLHLFLRNVTPKKINAVSYFAQDDESYMEDQLELKVIKIDIIRK